MDNCKILAETYLLNQNPLYAFNFPISLLVGIVFFGLSKAFNWSKNSYINQILIPVVAFLCTMVILDIISRLMISKSAKEAIVAQCASKENFANSMAKKKMMTTEEEEHVNPKLPMQPKKKMIESFNNMFVGPDNNYEKQNNNNNNENFNNIVEEQIRIRENIEAADLDYTSLKPMPIESKDFVGAKCIEPSNCLSLCSGSGAETNPCNLVTAIPGPQWLPETAATVQNRLVNNDYTAPKCSFAQ